MNRLLISVIFISGIILACNITDRQKDISFSIRTDDRSIAEGKSIFESKCGFCHSTNSTEMITGPGLLGVLKRSKLPASRKPATPENIKLQFKTPYRSMPSFAYLSEDEMQYILAYLYTL
ncbi:MAG: cytochrome c [Nitrospirota bacterium]|nr:cytochrome c [Nitrospirota bacterium]